MSIHVSQTDAYRAGHSYLLDHVKRGAWRETWTTHPPYSDTFVDMPRRSVPVTYLGARGLRTAGPIDSKARSQLAIVLAEARRGDLYAYSRVERVVGWPDADDTAFAFRTRLLLGEEVTSEEVSRAADQFRDGELWKTFAVPLLEPTPLVVALEYVSENSILGYHPDAILNLLCALREAQAPAPLDSLAKLPRHNGLFLNYHYPSRLYATWLAAELVRGRAPEWEVEIDRAVLSCQGATGGWDAVADGFSEAQETSLGLLCMSPGALATPPSRRALAYLQSLQQEDGSWPGETIWRWWHIGHGGRILVRAHEANRVAATGLALMALNRFADPGATVPPVAQV